MDSIVFEAFKNLNSWATPKLEPFWQHNMYVKSVVPKEDLLVWNLKEGWEPFPRDQFHMTTRLGTQNGYGITDSGIKCLQLVWSILHSIFYFSFSNASLESIWWTHATNGSLNKFQSGLSSDSFQLLLKKLSVSFQTPWQNFPFCDCGRYIDLNWSIWSKIYILYLCSVSIYKLLFWYYLSNKTSSKIWIILVL